MDLHEGEGGGGVIRNIDEAIDMARQISISGLKVYNQMCLRFCRMMFGIPNKYESAADAWKLCAKDHAGKGFPPPRGSLTYWTGGSVGDGHVAINDGAGGIWSNWYPSEGRIRHMTMDDVKRAMPNLHYAGWSWVINDYDVRTGGLLDGTPAPAPKGGKSVPSKVEPRPGKGLGTKWSIADGFPGRSAFTLGKPHPAVEVVGEQLVALGFDKHFSGKKYDPSPTFTRFDLANVKDWQQSIGEKGTDADGILGERQWNRLFEDEGK